MGVSGMIAQFCVTGKSCTQQGVGGFTKGTCAAETALSERMMSYFPPPGLSMPDRCHSPAYVLA